jgi:uncharacterized membrane protein YfcA
MSTILAAGIIFISFVINAFAGFGGGIVAVPLLALLFPLRTLSPLVNLLGFTSNLFLIKTFYKNVQYSILAPLVLGNLMGSVIGIHYLLVVQNSVLLKILGVIILLSSVILFLVDKKFVLKPNILVGLIAGFLSGLLSALFSVGGPPLILYLTSIIKDKTQLRTTSLAFFFINGIMQVILIFINKLATKEVLTLFLIFFPILIFANWIGHKIHLKASEEVFRKFVFVILIFSGIILLIK